MAGASKVLEVGDTQNREGVTVFHLFFYSSISLSPHKKNTSQFLFVFS